MFTVHDETIPELSRYGHYLTLLHMIRTAIVHETDAPDVVDPENVDKLPSSSQCKTSVTTPSTATGEPGG